MDSTAPSWYADVLNRLLERRDLDAETMRLVFSDLIAGRCGDVETAALLTALRAKGETAEEIAASARVLREHMVCLGTERPDVLDTSGTGGDGTGSFNISTATALVAAGTGVPVVKHGNRAVSSRSGSADVLTELGVRLHEGTDWPRRCLAETGLAFCFAPYFHPVMGRFAAVRRRLRIRTLFNCLGPLANPAGAAYQLLGVGRPELLDLLAQALAQLGSRHAFLVHGQDGLDEVSLSAPTLVREVQQGRVTAQEWTPASFGLEPCSREELAAEDARASARTIRAILDGADGAPRRIVLANTAAALLAAGRVASLPAGVHCAAEAISSGKARRVLDRLVACSEASTR